MECRPRGLPLPARACNSAGYGFGNCGCREVAGLLESKPQTEVERADIEWRLTRGVFDGVRIALRCQVIKTLLGTQVGAELHLVAFFLPKEFEAVAKQQSDLIVPTVVVLAVHGIVPVETRADGLINLCVKAFPEKLPVAKREGIIGKIALVLPEFKGSDVEAGVDFTGIVAFSPDFVGDLSLVNVSGENRPKDVDFSAPAFGGACFLLRNGGANKATEKGKDHCGFFHRTNTFDVELGTKLGF